MQTISPLSIAAGPRVLTVENTDTLVSRTNLECAAVGCGGVNAFGLDVVGLDVRIGVRVDRVFRDARS